MPDSAAKARFAEMKAALARYERTTAFLPVYIYAARIEDGQVIPEFYSPVVERITGYGSEEFLRDPWFWLKLVYEEDRPSIDEALKEDFYREHEVTEYRIVRKDGKIRWVRDQLRVSFDERGKPSAYYGTVEDITEGKQIEAKLAASEQRYRDLVETADDIIYQQNSSGAITSINVAGERFFKRTREEIIGQPWLKFLAQFSACVRPSAAIVHNELMKMGIARMTVEFPATEDMEEAILEFRMTLMHESASAESICAVGRDITMLEQQRSQLTDAYLQLENIQDQVVRNERMVAMAQLAGTVMHEINNPLSVILGYAQMLPQLHNLPAQAVIQLQKIEEMSLRISDIIKQLDGLEDSIVEFGEREILDLHRQHTDGAKQE